MHVRKVADTTVAGHIISSDSEWLAASSQYSERQQTKRTWLNASHYWGLLKNLTPSAMPHVEEVACQGTGVMKVFRLKDWSSTPSIGTSSYAGPTTGLGTECHVMSRPMTQLNPIQSPTILKYYNFYPLLFMLLFHLPNKKPFFFELRDRTMVQHGIHIDLHARSLTSAHHGGETVFIARTAGEIIGHRLVASPPRATLNMFLRKMLPNHYQQKLSQLFIVIHHLLPVFGYKTTNKIIW